jgi:tetratricopeptide (TPR) repeat protein
MQERSDKEKDVLLSFADRVDRNDAGALNNLGVLYFRKGMYEEAIRHFKEAIEVDWKFALALENLRYLYSKTGLEDPEVVRWRKAVEEDPDNTDALLKLGVGYQSMGRFREAFEVLGNLVYKEPDNLAARIRFANVLKAQGLYQQALEHYLHIGPHAADSVVYHTHLGEVYYNLGRTEEAIVELEAAVEIDNDYWKSHFLLSFAYGDEGRLDEALEQSRVASSMNPSSQNAEANLALSEGLEEGDPDADMDTVECVTDIESTSYTLGIAYLERGYIKEALKEFTKALDETPEQGEVLIEIGKLHLLLGEGEQAFERFVQALEFDPESPDAYRFMGCWHQVKGNLFESAACYLTAYKLASVDANTMNDLGVLLHQSGLPDEAERMFKKGLTLRQYHVVLNFNLLNSMILKKEYKLAENHLGSCEDFMGPSALLHYKRALIYYGMGNLALALSAVDDALALDNTYYDAQCLKGLIHLRGEEFRNAIECIADAGQSGTGYTGDCFLLAIDNHHKLKPLVVPPSFDGEPDNELIAFLRAGINRSFDAIDDTLTAMIARAKAAADTGNAGVADRSENDAVDENLLDAEEDEVQTLEDLLP